MPQTRVIVCLALLFACATAVAEEPDAKTLFTRGRTAYALGRFAEAADLFEKAFELKQDPGSCTTRRRRIASPATRRRRWSSTRAT